MNDTEKWAAGRMLDFNGGANFELYGASWLVQVGLLFQRELKQEWPQVINWQNLLLSVFNTSLEYAGAKWHHPQTFAGRLFSFGWLFARALLAGKILNSQP